MTLTTARSDVVLTIDGLSKSFPAQKALENVSLELRAGEVHCLLGQNGCGKSTLIKILAGYHSPDPGSTASLNGDPLVLGTPAIRDRAVAFIHQDLGLVTELDAVDNLALGNRYKGRFWLSARRELRAARKLMSEFGLDMDPSAPLADATPGEQTMLAIVRAVAATDGAPSVLVLDEVTASLPQHQVEQLFSLLRRLRDRGTAILYVTHRLPEVFEIGDTVTVLRDGRRITTCSVDSLDVEGLVEVIIGRKPEEFSPALPTANAEVLMRIDSVSGDQVAAFSLDLFAGEIVGVTGLIGSGYDQALGLAFGARRRGQGEVSISGAVVAPNRPDRSIASGIAYAPADRKRLSTIQQWTASENITLPRIPSSGPGRWLGNRLERREVRPWIDLLDVVPRDPDRQLSLLSGGNQQKLVLARWLRIDAQVMLLDEPTSGVDAGSKTSIYKALAAIAAQGRAVVLSSSDAEELCVTCDRVVVMSQGRVRAVLNKSELTVDRIVTETIRENTHQNAEGVKSP